MRKPGRLADSRPDDFIVKKGIMERQRHSTNDCQLYYKDTKIRPPGQYFSEKIWPKYMQNFDNMHFFMINRPYLTNINQFRYSMLKAQRDEYASAPVQERPCGNMEVWKHKCSGWDRASQEAPKTPLARLLNACALMVFLVQQFNDWIELLGFRI